MGCFVGGAGGRWSRDDGGWGWVGSVLGVGGGVSEGIMVVDVGVGGGVLDLVLVEVDWWCWGGWAGEGVG